MAQELGYQTVFWSLAYVDWYADNQPTAEQAYAKLLPRIHNGAIVLLHSTSSTNAAILGRSADEVGGHGLPLRPPDGAFRPGQVLTTHPAVSKKFHCPK